MLYLYYKRAHTGCLIAFLLLTVANAVVLLSTGAEISVSEDIDLILLGTIPLLFYLISILLPEVSYRITCPFLSLFAKRPASEIREDSEIKRCFLRGRFFPLLIEDFVLLLIFLNLIPYLFK